MKYFLRLFPYLRPYWKLAVTSAVITVLGAGASLLSPWPLQLLVDNVLGSMPLPAILAQPLGSVLTNRTSLLIFAVLAGLVITAVQGAMNVFHNYVNTKIEQSIVLDFRGDLFRHAQRLSVA